MAPFLKRVDVHVHIYLSILTSSIISSLGLIYVRTGKPHLMISSAHYVCTCVPAPQGLPMLALLPLRLIFCLPIVLVYMKVHVHSTLPRLEYTDQTNKTYVTHKLVIYLHVSTQTR